MQFEMRLFEDGHVEGATEEWREVAGFAGYECSTMGRFRKKRTGQYLGGTTVHNGYLHIGLFRNGAQVTKLAHRLIAETWLEKASEKHNDVNHRNKVRTDNRASNLEWATRSQNSKHARKKEIVYNGRATFA